MQSQPSRSKAFVTRSVSLSSEVSFVHQSVNDHVHAAGALDVNFRTDPAARSRATSCSRSAGATIRPSLRAAPKGSRRRRLRQLPRHDVAGRVSHGKHGKTRNARRATARPTISQGNAASTSPSVRERLRSLQISAAPCRDTARHPRGRLHAGEPEVANVPHHWAGGDDVPFESGPAAGSRACDCYPPGSDGE